MVEDRTRQVEERVAALQTATSHGFGRIETEIAHLRQLVQETLGKPAPATPVWLVLIAVGTCATGVSSLIVGIVQLLR